MIDYNLPTEIQPGTTYIVMGGSPCTKWSCAQKNNRETEAEGIGWELFKNYLIAVRKFKELAEKNGAKFLFLYENNKSAAEPIKAQIRKELGVTEPSLFENDNGVRFTLINSALVSAQNRQRFYVTNFGDIEQPEDRGILLKDILETGLINKEKAYCLKHQAGNARDHFKKHHTNIAFETVCVAEPIDYTPRKGSHIVINENAIRCTQDKNNASVAESFVNFEDGKANTLTTVSGRAKCIEPVCVAERGRQRDGKWEQQVEAREDNKTNALTTVQKDNQVCEPLCLQATADGQGARTGLYATPITPQRVGGWNTQKQGNRLYGIDGKSAVIRTSGSEAIIEPATEKAKKVYEVKDGLITIKGKQYPIKLSDGYYIIRKLTVTECCRLQTMPDDYCRAVSATQGYKGLGNGWTAEVIIHLLQHAKIPLDEEIVVCSMYDGIGTGRYVLDKMGYKNVTYHAYEIDKYAMQVSMSNYPDIIQHGDAFAVRDDNWQLDNITKESGKSR